MVKTELVEAARIAGRDFLLRLDAARLNVVAAFWHFDFDREDWFYVIASPMVNELGATEFYTSLHPIWQEHRDLDWTKLHALRTSDKLVQILNSVGHTGPGIHGIVHERWVVKGTFVGEAYIYRMNL